jgi:hypothetical protein
MNLPLVLLTVLFSNALLLAQEEQGGAIEEIIVISELSKPALEAQIIAVENDFFGLFNEKNGNKNLDFECRREVATGTHLPQRVCEPVFLIKARLTNNSNWSAGTDILLTPDTLQASLARDYEKLNAAYAKLLMDDPRFSELVAILTALRARMTELQ